MDQKIFRELNMTHKTSPEEQEQQLQSYEKFSLSQIAIRNKIALQMGRKTTVEPTGSSNRFTVFKPNKNAQHDDENGRKRTIEVRVFDLIYKRQPCSLIHMRDLTKLLKSTR